MELIGKIQAPQLKGVIYQATLTAQIKCVASVAPTLPQIEALFANLPEYMTLEDAAADLEVGQLFTGAEGSDSLSKNAIYIVK